MFRFQLSRFLIIAVALAAFIVPVHWTNSIQSANLVEVSVTLSNPRLSYSAILNGSNTVGTNIVNINTTAGAAPSTSTANLFEGEAVTVGANGYTVASVSAEGSFTVTTALAAGDADVGDLVISTQRPAMSVGFETVTSMQQNWSFRVLVPAGTTDPDDGVPDDDGWDYGSATAGDIDVTCPTGNTYTITRGIADVTIGGTTYHSFDCNLDDATVIAPGADYTANPIIIGDAADPLDSLINPANSATHISGYADSYPIIVQQLDASNNIVDQSIAAVAIVDAVRITASVPPQISFRILGVASGAARCGVTTTTATTSVLAPFGELLIDAFKNMAQELIVSTNAANGYAVTAVSENQLHRVGEACVGDADATDGGCIQDTVGNNADITQTTPGLWTATTAKGFGYSLEELSLSSTATPAFEDDSVTGTCAGAAGSCWRQFADAESAEAPVTIFSSTGVADNDTVSICYRGVIPPTQVAGTDYSTFVTYRATATF